MRDIERAKGKLLLKHVFYATPLLGSPLIETRDIPTAATDMRSIFWNPDFFEELDVEQIIFVLAHEVLHILLKHNFRQGGRIHKIWNIACDHVINRILVDGKVGKKPPVGVFDPEGVYKDMSEEQIYDKLLEQAKSKRKGKGQGQGQGGSGDPSPGDASTLGEELDDGGMGGDLIELPEETSANEISKIKGEIDQKLATAANMARLIGKLPAELEKLIEELLNPAVPWQDLLRDYMTRLVFEDESWMRRNRRFTHVYLPARHSERMAGMTIIGDTSGSIGPEDYKRIATEIKAIIEDVNPEYIRVLWADTKTASIQMMQPEDFTGPKDLKPKGGGGTDMRVPLKDAEDYDPPVVVLITDGYTPWPEVEPPYPLIVVCTTDVKCPVGQVVRVK